MAAGTKRVKDEAQSIGSENLVTSQNSKNCHTEWVSCFVSYLSLLAGSLGSVDRGMSMLVTVAAADLQNCSEVAKHDWRTSRSREIFTRRERIFLQALFRSFRCQVRIGEKDSSVMQVTCLGVCVEALLLQQFTETTRGSRCEVLDDTHLQKQVRMSSCKR